ncbi:MAG: hypothetical protein WEF28_00905 [Acidimicrobiia bacterium]
MKWWMEVVVFLAVLLAMGLAGRVRGKKAADAYRVEEAARAFDFPFVAEADRGFGVVSPTTFQYRTKEEALEHFERMRSADDAMSGFSTARLYSRVTGERILVREFNKTIENLDRRRNEKESGDDPPAAPGPG